LQKCLLAVISECINSEFNQINLNSDKLKPTGNNNGNNFRRLQTEVVTRTQSYCSLSLRLRTKKFSYALCYF